MTEYLLALAMLVQPPPPADVPAAPVDPYEGFTGVLIVGATWCGPCQRISSEKDKLVASDESWDDRGWFRKLDVDKDRSEAMRLGIRSIPTLVYFKDGVERSRKQGGWPPWHRDKWPLSTWSHQQHARFLRTP